MEKTRIKQERSLSVVQQNDIVQKARYKLDLVQQKTLMYLISKIDSVKDVDFKNITVEIKDLCDVMGIKYNGRSLKEFQDSIQKLSDKSLWVDTGPQIRLMRWLQRVDIDKGSASVTVRFDELMEPFLLQIHNCFVQYQLVNVLPMKSQYSLRMYELIKSHETQGKWEVSLEELKKLLFLEQGAYERYDVFRRRIIDSSIVEICNYTDLMVAFTPKRKDRKIVSLSFEMCNILEEHYTEGARREINRAIVLDELQAEVVSLKKMPTVAEIRSMREKQRKARELAKIANIYKNAKRPPEYFEEVTVMPSQTTIDDLI